MSGYLYEKVCKDQNAYVVYLHDQLFHSEAFLNRLKEDLDIASIQLVANKDGDTIATPDENLMIEVDSACELESRTVKVDFDASDRCPTVDPALLDSFDLFSEDPNFEVYKKLLNLHNQVEAEIRLINRRLDKAVKDLYGMEFARSVYNRKIQEEQTEVRNGRNGRKATAGFRPQFPALK